MERYTSRPDAYFVKNNVDKHENVMHKYIYNLKIDGINIPRPVMYKKTTRQFVMEKIDLTYEIQHGGENLFLL